MFSKTVIACGVTLGLAISASAALANEFKSVAVNAAVLYDGPSAKAKRIFIAPRGMPVQVVSVVEPYIKVRDVSGDLFWVDRRSLGSVRMLVTTATVSLRTQAQDSASASTQVERGVLLELLDTGASGWVRVKHSDGAAGFVKASEVWGL